MARHCFSSSALIAVVLSLLLADPSLADDRSEREQVRDALRRGAILPLSGILAIVAKHTPGNVIKTELESDDNGTLIYAIKVLGTDGRVRKLKLDAHSGRILRTKTEDSD
ncbi:PepSY domain-containing protein [Steroidobacter sp.]|uniref:PepSY domain-containing protein n=1 Tax=Steroidobacter sp. TaxID=1978227 RepID=UPI001A451212|nr:PepSY domain-containing protein [Steroidobacter sp.]MBL8267761.1 PepSY domain-containing protein [Steroidobacter sp.]